MGLGKGWQSNSERGGFFPWKGYKKKQCRFWKQDINIELVAGNQARDNEQFPHQVSSTSRSHLMEEHQMEGDGPQGAALATILANTRPWLSPQRRQITGSILGNKALPMGPHPNFTLTWGKKKTKPFASLAPQPPNTNPAFSGGRGGRPQHPQPRAGPPPAARRGCPRLQIKARPSPAQKTRE